MIHRNPKWHRDEIIVALDLYFDLEPGQINHKNPAIVEVSNILNKLPIHDIRPDEVRFRNPNGCSMKLGNFLAIDPNYHGKGLEAGSALDEIVFKEFQHNREELKNIARRIRQAVSNPELNYNLYALPDDQEDMLLEVREGKVIYKLHKFRERDPKINKKKKEIYLYDYGKLDCEVCKFDFYDFYGEIGQGFIECHHCTPLSLIEAESMTTLNDLALICSNCHRMIHRDINSLSIQELRSRIR